MPENLKFRVDTMGLLTEIAEYSIPRTHGVLKVPLNVFKNILGEVAERAIKINDPELNILMLRLGLYEATSKEIVEAIQYQEKLIKRR